MNPPDAMFPPRPTALVHEILRPMIAPGDVVIDATAGNGHDTLFLAECVGASGLVLAFDVQAAAIFSASARIDAADLAGRVRFYQESHAAMGQYADPGSISVIMFNLGYLPGEDHEVTTESGETMMALEAGISLLKRGGILSVVCYPGHPAGATEAEEVERRLTALTSSGWRVAKYGALGTRRPAPFLIIAAR